MSDNDTKKSRSESVAPDLAKLASNRRLSVPRKKKRKAPYRQLEDGMPTFSDLGWLAKKCLKFGYELNGWRTSCSTRSRKWLNMFTFGEGERKMKSVTGGVSFRESTEIFDMTQSWQTEGWVSTNSINIETVIGVLTSMLKCAYLTKEKYVVSYNEYIINTNSPRYFSPGLQVEVDVGYERFPVKLEVIIPIKVPEPKIRSYIVALPTLNCLLAYRMIYDIPSRSFDKQVLGVCYNNYRTELCLKL